MDKVLKCRFCDQETVVAEEVIALLASPKSSKSGNAICKKWGHSFVEKNKENKKKNN